MVKKFTLITLLIFALAGCFENKRAANNKTAMRLDSSAGMLEYLQRQRLPALKSIEPWENVYGPGLKLTTAHYEVFTTLFEPLMLTQVPGFVESCYRGYNKQLPSPVESGLKLKIYLLADRQQWDDFTKSFAGPQASVLRKIKAGAYFMKGVCVAYNIGRERTFSVIGHEGWHQFNSRHFKYRLPSWLDEGISMLFEASRYDRGLFYFEPTRNTGRLASLKQTLIKGKMIPLKELISLNPGEVIVDSEDAVMAFYSQAYALIRFLREDGYGKRLPNYHAMLMDGLHGRWDMDALLERTAADRSIPLTVGWNKAVGRKLFEQYIGLDFDKLEEEYVLFCRKIVYHVKIK